MASYAGFQRSIFSYALASLFATVLLTAPARGQASAGDSSLSPTSVDALVAEAMRSNPEIAAARSRWRGASKIPRQVATLDDPQVFVQEFTVGSPAPASGYETSDFYYTGFGAAQDIPGPGKLKLRAQRAEKDAEYARASLESTERRIAEKVRETAFNLFYLEQSAQLLQQTRDELLTIEQTAEQQYRTGMGQQQDVLKAQLAATSIVKDLETNREDIESAEASLKAMLGREGDSRDIEIASVTPTALKLDDAQLGQAADTASSEVRMARAMVSSSQASLELAHRNYWPDFSIGYQYDKTGPGFRDYYMLTVGAKIPLYFWRKQTPAVEQAAEEKAAAHSQLHATRLAALSDLRSNMVAVHTQDRIVTLYRDGLIPQGEATLESARAAYRTGKVDFQTLLSAVNDLLNLREGYYRAVADHEIAVARVKQIIGEQS